MRHQMRPSVDGLENRALLSHGGAGLVAQHEVQPAVSARPSWMAFSLWTDQKTYNIGQVVHMHLSFTNVTSSEQTVALGPSIDGFLIRQNGKLIWQSNAGAQPAYAVSQTLAPGQSITLSAQCTMRTPGTFVVSNQMCPEGPVGTFTVTAGSTSPRPQS
jgi:hypothetical protein